MTRTLLIASAFFCLSLSVVAQQPEPSSENAPVIDVHTHANFESKSGSKKTQAQLFEEWREAGVVGAVAHTSKHLFLECSAMLIGNVDEVPKEKVEAYLVRPVAWIFGYVEDPGKLMFGTDWPLTPIRPYLDGYKRAIPRQHWKAVFHDNAVRVFKFPSKP